MNAPEDRLGSVSPLTMSAARPLCAGHQLMQQLQPLCLQLDNEQIEAGQIAGRSRAVADKTQSGGVFSDGDRIRACAAACAHSRFWHL